MVSPLVCEVVVLVGPAERAGVVADVLRDCVRSARVTPCEDRETLDELRFALSGPRRLAVWCGPVDVDVMRALMGAGYLGVDAGWVAVFEDAEARLAAELSQEGLPRGVRFVTLPAALEDAVFVLLQRLKIRD